MENYSGIRKMLEINFQRDQVGLAHKGEISWNDPALVSNPKPDAPSVDPNEFIHSLFDWWQDNHHIETQSYDKRLYPISVDDLIQGLHDRDRSVWMILLVLGALHTMGRTTHEQHRNFIEFCMRRSPNWWTIFARPNPQRNPDAWMSVLEDYMNDQIGAMQWYAWVEKFPTIYRIARYLDDYIQTFLSIKNTSSVFISQLIAPRTNQVFSGGGPDAPPIRLGIGINFVLRELVRFGILLPQEHIIQHCFVPRANVRRLLTRLGCNSLSSPDPYNSQLIHQFLSRHFFDLNLTIPPTFKNAFDIPFELVVENPDRIGLPQSGEFDLDKIDVEEDFWYESEDADNEQGDE